MPNSFTDQAMKLDPWSASSLLQKSIRRGEVELAQQAAAALYRMRGNAIWRRLMIIALEDVGLGNPGLVWHTTQIATDKDLRASYGPAPGLLFALCARLATAPKDRSVDYLYCAATKLETALADRAAFDAASVEDRLAVVVGDFEPLTRRAVAALSLCTRSKADRQVMSHAAVTQVVAALNIPWSHPLTKTVLKLAEQASHPYSLMLLLLWSQWHFTGGSTGIATDPLPEAEHVRGVPLYVFDKHTAVGKRALSMLPKRCAEIANVLAKWVPVDRRAEVTLMAAFYADAAPVSLRLEWFAGRQMEFIGRHADMMSVGCPYVAVEPVVECVQNNLAAMNELRRAVLERHTATIRALDN